MSCNPDMCTYVELKEREIIELQSDVEILTALYLDWKRKYNELEEIING